MTTYRVTMVDVNDVRFYFFADAETPEAAAGTAAFENRYCNVVEVAERAGYPDDPEAWEVVYVEGEGEEEYYEDDYEDGMSDVEADADTLRNCGWGTDEDYFWDVPNEDYI